MCHAIRAVSSFDVAKDENATRYITTKSDIHPIGVSVVTPFTFV